MEHTNYIRYLQYNLILFLGVVANIGNDHPYMTGISLLRKKKLVIKTFASPR